MGIINWFKDKRMSEFQYELKTMKSEIVDLHSRIDILITNMNSLRGLINRKVGHEKISNDDEQPSLDDIAKAFGGQLPIELVKYGKENN